MKDNSYTCESDSNLYTIDTQRVIPPKNTEIYAKIRKCFATFAKVKSH